MSNNKTAYILPLAEVHPVVPLPVELAHGSVWCHAAAVRPALPALAEVDGAGATHAAVLTGGSASEILVGERATVVGLDRAAEFGIQALEKRFF